MKENRRMSTCNRLDLQTLGSQPIMSNNLSNHCSYDFHLEGLLNFSFSVWRASSNPRRQSKNIEMKYKTRIKLVHELYGTRFQYNVEN